MEVPDPITIIWAKVPGLPLEASNTGEVRTMDGSPALITIDKWGYPCATVHVEVDGLVVAKIRHVHRIVCDTFYGLLPPGLVTRHKNDRKGDNRLGNLTYGLPQENGRDRARNRKARSIVP